LFGTHIAARFCTLRMEKYWECVGLVGPEGRELKDFEKAGGGADAKSVAGQVNTRDGRKLLGENLLAAVRVGIPYSYCAVVRATEKAPKAILDTANRTPVFAQDELRTCG